MGDIKFQLGQRNFIIFAAPKLTYAPHLMGHKMEENFTQYIFMGHRKILGSK